jgi:hypothetical protein
VGSHGRYLSHRQDPELWASCIGGALIEEELTELSREAGLVDCRIAKRFESFAATSAEARVSRDLRLGAVNFSARKAS